MTDGIGDGPEIIHGDCIDVMLGMGDDSVDSIVTDPPYGLGFMGKEWDKLPPGQDWAEECLRVLKPCGYLLAFGGTRTWHRLAVAIEDAGFEIRDSIAWMHSQGFPKNNATLKAAFEPVVVARKPLKGTLENNKAVYGTGEYVIDAARIPSDDDTSRPQGKSIRGANYGPGGFGQRSTIRTGGGDGGRWPANVVLDEAQANRLAESKFFYVAKPSKAERPSVGGVVHPSVKPLSLMRWLIRLVTPSGGVVLDTFAGSGATVEAAILEGFHCIAIEREAEYLLLIQQRIRRAA